MQQRAQTSAKDVFEKATGFTRADVFSRPELYPYFTEFSDASDLGEAQVVVGDRRILMFGSNNYLGLTTHPEVKQAAKDAIDSYGTGCSGSPMLHGTLDLHVRLEEAVAGFMKREAAVVFGTGFQTNQGALSSLAQKGDVLIADQDIHPSSLEGSLASFGRTIRYRHNDMADLENVVASIERTAGRLIVVDGVFTIEGDTANLPEIVRIASRYQARVYLDEAQAVGVLGANGRGTAEHFGVESGIDIVMGTFSKSFGSVGGFVATRRDIVEYIKHHSRAFVYSSSIAPPSAAAALKAIEIIQREPERRQRLLSMGARLRRELSAIGFKIPEGFSPVIPVVIDDDQTVCKFFWELMGEGIYTNPVLAPVVSRSLIRISCMATHSDEHAERLLESMYRIGKKLHLIA